MFDDLIGKKLKNFKERVVMVTTPNGQEQLHRPVPGFDPSPRELIPFSEEDFEQMKLFVSSDPVVNVNHIPHHLIELDPISGVAVFDLPKSGMIPAPEKLDMSKFHKVQISSLSGHHCGTNCKICGPNGFSLTASRPERIDFPVEQIEDVPQNHNTPVYKREKKKIDRKDTHWVNNLMAKIK